MGTAFTHNNVDSLGRVYQFPDAHHNEPKTQYPTESAEGADDLFDGESHLEPMKAICPRTALTGRL